MGSNLMYEDLKRAVNNEKIAWPYVKAILNNWHQAGHVPLIDVYLAEEEYHNKRKQHLQKRRPPP